MESIFTGTPNELAAELLSEYAVSQAFGISQANYSPSADVVVGNTVYSATSGSNTLSIRFDNSDNEQLTDLSLFDDSYINFPKKILRKGQVYQLTFLAVYVDSEDNTQVYCPELPGNWAEWETYWSENTPSNECTVYAAVNLIEGYPVNPYEEQISGYDIQDGAVDSDTIEDGSISSVDIANGTITPEKLSELYVPTYSNTSDIPTPGEDIAGKVIQYTGKTAVDPSPSEGFPSSYSPGEFFQCSGGDSSFVPTTYYTYTIDPTVTAETVGTYYRYIFAYNSYVSVVLPDHYEEGMTYYTRELTTVYHWNHLDAADLSGYALRSKMFYPDNQYGTKVVTNLDTLSVSGSYVCLGTATGAPNSDSSWFVIHINSSGGTEYGFQTAKAHGDFSGLYYRVKSHFVWTAWELCPAADIGITDAGGFYDGDTVEAALQELGKLYFTDKSIAESDWVSDTTYTDYGYKCDITCTGVTASMLPTVMFAHAEAISGNYSPIAVAGTGIVTVYSKVNTAITIPTIKCEVTS